MKFKFTSLAFLLVTIFTVGCVKNTPAPNVDPSIIAPIGNYIGTFQLIHLNKASNLLDTSYADVNILLNSDLTFSVGGDTTKIQAPSHGTFSVDNANSLMVFTDATVTKRTNPNAPKKHLNGTFLYTNNPPNLRIYGSSDTLSFNYTLTKN